MSVYTIRCKLMKKSVKKKAWDPVQCTWLSSEWVLLVLLLLLEELRCHMGYTSIAAFARDAFARHMHGTLKAALKKSLK